MKNVKIKVKRSQMYWEKRDGGSFNYQYEDAPISLDVDNVWAWSGCTTHEARPAFLEYIKSGKTPDFTEQISSVKMWLSEHGHKSGDWASRIKQENRNLEFLLGGYKKYALEWEAVEVIYEVTTLGHYKIPKSNYNKWLPIENSEPGQVSNFVEVGFIKRSIKG